jgi:hypothetical protein
MVSRCRLHHDPRRDILASFYGFGQHSIASLSRRLSMSHGTDIPRTDHRHSASNRSHVNELVSRYTICAISDRLFELRRSTKVYQVRDLRRFELCESSRLAFSSATQRWLCRVSSHRTHQPCAYSKPDLSNPRYSECPFRNLSYTPVRLRKSLSS